MLSPVGVFSCCADLTWCVFLSNLYITFCAVTVPWTAVRREGFGKVRGMLSLFGTANHSGHTSRELIVRSFWMFVRQLLWWFSGGWVLCAILARLPSATIVLDCGILTVAGRGFVMCVRYASDSKAYGCSKFIVVYTGLFSYTVLAPLGLCWARRSLLVWVRDPCHVHHGSVYPCGCGRAAYWKWSRALSRPPRPR